MLPTCQARKPGTVQRFRASNNKRMPVTARELAYKASMFPLLFSLYTTFEPTDDSHTYPIIVSVDQEQLDHPIINGRIHPVYHLDNNSVWPIHVSMEQAMSCITECSKTWVETPESGYKANGRTRRSPPSERDMKGLELNTTSQFLYSQKIERAYHG